jgi:hypothetical protein
MARAPRPGVPVDEHAHRQLELTVLTQLRDSLAQMNANMTRLNEKVDMTHDRVTELAAAKFDVQIARAVEGHDKDLSLAKEHLQRQVDDLKAAGADREVRLRDQSAQLARLGLGMAIAGALATGALTAVVLLVVRAFTGGAT